jgi:hypothetical protein
MLVINIKDVELNLVLKMTIGEDELSLLLHENPSD